MWQSVSPFPLTQNAPAEAPDGLATEHSDDSIALLSAAYFPPVQWFQKLHRHAHCVIDTGEHFVKQTYRNRCIIATATATQTLTVPTEKSSEAKMAMRDTRISDHGEWRHLHWNALVSAYGESPFFSYYADDLRPFFEERYESLAAFDIAITQTLCRLLDVRPDITISNTYVDATHLAKSTGKAVNDFRETIRPKHSPHDEAFTPRPYYQVYARRHGFLPNLSVADLLFNEGPEAIFYL